MRALRRGGPHPPPAPRPCVPEAAAGLPSAPGTSPMPPAGSGPAATPHKPVPSAAPESDICSRAASASAARRPPRVAPERAEDDRPRARRAGKSRAEPEAGRSGTPARPEPSWGLWPEGAGGSDAGRIAVCFGQVFKAQDCETEPNLGKIQGDPAGNHSLHRDVIGSWGC